jgi:hypothetical protein
MTIDLLLGSNATISSFTTTTTATTSSTSGREMKRILIIFKFPF